METPEKKGIVFVQEMNQKVVRIHPDTFKKFIEGLQSNERGWVVLNFEDFKQLNHRNHFARVHPKKAS